MKELNYLAEKERKIIDAAQEVIDDDIQGFLGDHLKFEPKLQAAAGKVVDKMNILEDYYSTWEKIKEIKFKTEKASDTVDKQIYNFITKTYGEIKKLTCDYNELKNKIKETIIAIENAGDGETITGEEE